MSIMDDITLKEIRARYSKGEKGYHYQPPADRMWKDARALLFMVEDLAHELQLLRQHVAGCPRCEAVEDDDRAKARSNQ
jgi:hypothetical protein